MKQTWTTKGPPKPSWDIAERAGIWQNGVDWVDRPGRMPTSMCWRTMLSTIPQTTGILPKWKFLVIPTFRLPAARTIGLGPALKLAIMVDVHGLANAVCNGSSQQSTATKMSWQPGDSNSSL